MPWFLYPTESNCIQVSITMYLSLKLPFNIELEWKNCNFMINLVSEKNYIPSVGKNGTESGTVICSWWDGKF